MVDFLKSRVSCGRTHPSLSADAVELIAIYIFRRLAANGFTAMVVEGMQNVLELSGSDDNEAK